MTGERPAELSEARWFETPLRVRYAETDKMAVVYYANYFIWFEIGRTDLCRQCGFSYRDMEVDDDAYLMVTSADCRYLRSARYDDDLVVRTKIAAMSTRTMRFDYQVVRAGGELLAEGSTGHVVTTSAGRPRRFPAAQAAMLQDCLNAHPAAATVAGGERDRTTDKEPAR